MTIIDVRSLTAALNGCMNSGLTEQQARRGLSLLMPLGTICRELTMHNRRKRNE